MKEIHLSSSLFFSFDIIKYDKLINFLGSDSWKVRVLGTYYEQR